MQTIADGLTINRNLVVPFGAGAAPSPPIALSAGQALRNAAIVPICFMKEG